VALVSLGTLGRSFGLVAANRGVKTGGPYGFVRHPAYTGYLIAYVGYCAENPSLRNISLLVASTAFQLVRIREEEHVLSTDEGYRDYSSRVRFRLVPYVY
jgi:protein-S-isoprenylcysteine O-methyltransferase Ste14